MHRVVVLGGGYAGVRVAWDLAQHVIHGGSPELEIILVSDKPHHLDTTALYEVATAFLPHESNQSSEQVSRGAYLSLTQIFAATPVTVVIREVSRIDRVARILYCTDKATISYDDLVIAVGAGMATYHIPGVLEHAFILKNLSEALRLRHHMVRQFHEVKHLTPSEIKKALTFVIVGGGAAGVETAAEWAHHVRKQCRNINLDLSYTRVVLIEASEEILREAPAAMRGQVHQMLTRQRVEVRTGVPVTKIEADRVWLGEGGESIFTRTVIWTTGLVAHPLLVDSGLPITAFGLTVEPTLRVLGEKNIYAAGDCARISGQSNIPATVPVAYQQGLLVARNILHQLEQQPLQEYQYNQLGAVVTLGGKHALAYWPGMGGLVGFWPWLAKKLLTLHYWDRYLPWWTALAMWWQGIKMQIQND